MRSPDFIYCTYQIKAISITDKDFWNSYPNFY